MEIERQKVEAEIIWSDEQQIATDKLRGRWLSIYIYIYRRPSLYKLI